MKHVEVASIVAKSAILSPCGRYRYRLERRWADGPAITFCMLNPSTADAEIDDPTIRRCIGFAKRDGFGALIVVNLFALRATNPNELTKCEIDSYGPGNFDALDDALRAAGLVAPLVCAWGSNAFAAAGAAAFVRHSTQCGARLCCLGKTRDGSPRHPLYVRGDQKFEVFP